MKDLMKLVDICVADLNSLGIKCGKVRNWTINTRAKCRLGQCVKVSSDVFDISISNILLDDNVDEQIAKNTIIHELLHTVPGCFTHKSKWKIYSEYINRKLPNYCVKRAMKGDELGIEIKRKEPIYRYTLVCTNCGVEIKYQKKTKVIRDYKKYRCGKCGGVLKMMH